ncbi:acetolactate synthase [Nostocoides sp. F2B08]|uniref:acetolactate synthase n=1 Tax=Nostocoides sp. F2B08 TaxID=2653936 RepID=UPI0012634784|nr:acetolactate synthase [Tetrasphaera sp. F2B08]KAB7743538.1 acetolactate synthase [Tetrasphaera sp. F2B08]
MTPEETAQPTTETPTDTAVQAHGGSHATAVAAAHGVETMFTLSGAHVFPMYDAAAKEDHGIRLLDVRHEQTAAFAAEATGKLTRSPGLAVLTAGPGVTNGVSAITQAHFSGAPMVVIGGRAPLARWGSGSLQEFDHVPLLSSVTVSAETAKDTGDIAGATHRAFQAARSAHRGPAFLDVHMDHLFDQSESVRPGPEPAADRAPDTDTVERIAALLAKAERPVIVLGTDVWSDFAEEAALRCVEELGLPAIPNGMGRGVVPAGHPLLVTKARGMAFNAADLVVVVGTPLDFRLGYGVFGGKDGATPATVVHIQDSTGQLSHHANPAFATAGDLARVLDALTDAVQRQATRADWTGWAGALREKAQATHTKDLELLGAEADPIHPARIYGELLPRLADDAVVIGDGGDFVSFAGKFVEPKRPGNWLDPGPFGCLGAGLGAAIAARIARPSSQVVLLLGDGAAGFSLIDVDTLVRHNLPVVMVMGNNSAWALEKGPMQMIYGYDVIADLGPRTRYDEVVKALGGAGEMVTDPAQIGPAMDRAFASGVPYLVNVVTDVEAAYPRATFGV